MAASILSTAGDVRTNDFAEAVTANTLPGEWIGLAPDQHAMVVLRVETENRRSLLAISQRAMAKVRTNVYAVRGIAVHAGQVVVGGEATPVTLVANLKRTWGSGGSGEGHIVVRRQGEPAWKFDVHFFYWHGESWMRQNIDM